jgi:hypothetical protein
MKKELLAQEQEALLSVLKKRFEKNTARHEGLDWSKVEAKLETNPEKLYALHEMEASGGEPDVVAYEPQTDHYVFYDCVAESPKGRRSVCYDQQALEARKEHKPKDSALHMAAVMGVEVLTEEEYRYLQKLGKFDAKSSSWIKTPEAIRKHGGALFCDFRYEHVFVYHNGAESYYAVRGFRASLKV